MTIRSDPERMALLAYDLTTDITCLTSGRNTISRHGMIPVQVEERRAKKFQSHPAEQRHVLKSRQRGGHPPPAGNPYLYDATTSRFDRTPSISRWYHGSLPQRIVLM